MFKKENYLNLRAQCYFHLANAINGTYPKNEADFYYIAPEIKDRIYPFKSPKIYKGRTIEWILLHQLKAIKQNKPDADGKKSIIPKEEMKPILGGISPDLLDGLMMRERFELAPATVQKAVTKESLGIF